MTHARTQIRTAAAAALTGLATAGARVFKSRLRPVDDDELPCLLVYCDDERGIEKTTAGNPGRLSRPLELIVKGLVKKTTALDDELDKIAKEVEVAIAANITLGGLVREGVWLREIGVTMNEETEKPCGEIILVFSVTYSTNSNAPEVAL